MCLPSAAFGSRCVSRAINSRKSKKKRTINSAMIARNVLVCFWPSLPSLFWFKEFSLCRNLACVLCLVYVAGGYFYKNLYIGMISVHFDSEQLAFCFFTCKMKQPRCHDSLTSRLPVSFKWDTIWDSVLQTGKNKPPGRKHTRGMRPQTPEPWCQRSC